MASVFGDIKFPLEMKTLSNFFIATTSTKMKDTPAIVEGPSPEELLNNPKATMKALEKIAKASNAKRNNSQDHIMISGGPTLPILLGDPHQPATRQNQNPFSNNDQKFNPLPKEGVTIADIREHRSSSSTPVVLQSPTLNQASLPQASLPQPRPSQPRLPQTSLPQPRLPQSGFSQTNIPQGIASQATSARSERERSLQDQKQWIVQRQKPKQDDEQRFAAGALTLLCKAASPVRDGKSSRLQSGDSTVGKLDAKNMQDRGNIMHQNGLPTMSSNMIGSNNYDTRKRHFESTLSGAPMMPLVPGRAAMFQNNPIGRQLKVPRTQLQRHASGRNVLSERKLGNSVSSFVPAPKPNGYFFGIVASHGGTRKMNALGIPTMLVRLAEPQMHLTGFVVAGHVAWQDIGNCTDQNNWSMARCLMCIRFPTALELMICDPTQIHPAIQHVYICPSHCVRRFVPSLNGLKEQLKMDMISLPLSKPALPSYNTIPDRQNTGMDQSNMMPLPSPPAPTSLRTQNFAKNSLPTPNGNMSMALMYVNQQADSRDFVCNLCHKEFSCKSSLNRHMRIHSGVKPYQCKTCGKKFADKGVLDVHERIHSGKKPYQCTQCTKVFSQKGNLKRHMRIHSGDRPYKCNLCNKKFSQKGHLTAHLRIHTGQKPYTCEYCNKSFTQSSTLIGHKRTHTGERPYRCNICHKTFRQKGNLTAHMVMHQIHQQNDMRSSSVVQQTNQPTTFALYSGNQ
mmetsp:Transcript_12547/g.18749  ORF Transcript_12547/g.18749 Transcript_12547/m.18749 type:complete len:736 (-) Transcript_12547:215-2422(-)